MAPSGYQLEMVAEGLNGAVDLYRDVFGRLLVVEFGVGGPSFDGRVLEVGPDGSLAVVSSGYQNPTAVVVDGAGNLYVSDLGPSSLTGDTDGVIYKDDGSGPVPLSSPFTSPVDIALRFPTGGSILVAELSGLPPLAPLGDTAIISVSPVAGTQEVVFDDGVGTIPENLTNITSLALRAGTLYATDNGNSINDGNANLYRILSETTKAAVLSFPTPLEDPSRIRFAPSGRLFLADRSKETIFAVDLGIATPFITGVRTPVALWPEENALYFVDNFDTLWKASICNQLATRALAWWPLDGDVMDLVGTHDGALAGSGHQFVPAEVDLGFESGGAGSFVQMADSADFDVTRFTVSAWVKVQGLGSSRLPVVGKAPSGACTTGVFQVYVVSQGCATGPGVIESGSCNVRDVAFSIFDGASCQEIRSSTPLPLGQLTHVAVSVGGDEMRIYVNGRLDVAVAQQITPQVDDSVLFIAGSPSLDWFDGIVDEVQFYDRALSPCEIGDLHRAGVAGQCKGDSDGDTVADFMDNCPDQSNPGQENADGDGAGDVCDCDAADPGSSGNPREIRGVFLDEGGQALTWCSSQLCSGADTVADVLKGAIADLPVGSGSTETCLGVALGGSVAADTTTPNPGEGFYYLVRERNTCSVGSWGVDSSGSERNSSVCGP